jgi:hypothetical protein
MTDNVKRRKTDHPILWTLGGLGGLSSAMTNLHGLWWLWFICSVICWMSLLEWWERRRG